MNQLLFLEKNKKNYQIRFLILKLIRQFFEKQNFTEIDAPIIVSHVGQEPNIIPFQINTHNENKETFPGYLHTSPEYTMKKLLAIGFDKIFYLGKCFRDYESFGGTHNPEFTMAEWYRTNKNYFTLMDDLEKLFHFLSRELKKRKIKFNSKVNFDKIHKMTMKDLWKKYANVNLDQHLTVKSMHDLCQKMGFKPSQKESYESLFYRIFLNKIEPRLNKSELLIIYEYPAIMASLSKLSKHNPKYAERFELYAGDLELANAFTELTDAKEQKKRFRQEQKTQINEGRKPLPIDENLLQALPAMPPSAGIALGVDRIIQLFLACQNINDVIVLPASKQFK